VKAMDEKKLKNILEAGLLVAGRTLSIAQLEALFQQDEEKPERKQIREALDSLKADYEGRGIELVEVASGFRLQSHSSVSDWVANLFQEKAPRYSRALLETLVLIAYRQPITRAEIEDVRGVAVSSNIVKTLQERKWVKVLGHKEVPGRPALLGTSKEFLDYFNLKKLDDLPALADIKDLDQFDDLLAEEAGDVDEDGAAANEGENNENDAGENLANGHSPDETASVDPIRADGGSADNLADNSADNSADSSADSSDENLEKYSDSSSDHSAANGSVDKHEAHDDDQQADDAASANIDLGTKSADEDSDDFEKASEDASGSDDDNNSDSRSDDHSDDHSDGRSDDGSDNQEADETLSQPERDLMRVISNFSDEHQEEIDARDEMEERMLSKNADEETPDVGDLSQRLNDDGSGDMPEPGDTLH